MAELKTVAFHTLGCKLNFSETSSLSRILENEGFEKKEFDEPGRYLCDQYLLGYRKCR
jgi:threonylcarbamoyladenosine tRNA methylthiotransferase MtaB